ncbi:FKBP-type peptidyl-prolyl cis-trans isomerase [Limnobacter humi]|uniref:Peptidyl-prolyl cis-trans isomerase n=1 Tax=Limnobacter humi TaxID=1778671 RepID=A0ABT1WJB4_9BURK|nr:FKBP-type peptidyl-prolyl cis-trans isomerase [Limnobacter humi]MCQ8896514.1 FKBP-type peptidyl-prolyl cis-trans isomerase [Limnobacter humi]
MTDAAESKPVVNEQSFVTLHYRIRLADSQQVVVSTFEDKPATLQMGAGQLAEGLERCLMGMQAGQRDTFILPASSGYGDTNPDLYRPVSKALLNSYAEEGTTFEPGDFVHFPAPDGGQFAGTVVEDREDSILFDFNHPLAGKRLSFEVQLIGVL